MSFDFGPMQNLSNVQASHKSTAGGGGNTGYFQRGTKDEDDALLNFATEEYPPDSFEHMEIDIEEEKKDFLSALKALFKKVLSALKRLIFK